MRTKLLGGTTLLLLIGLFNAHPLFARTIYLNGIDISSARNQALKGVNLRIDENGNVFIEAPHYQVNEEQTYTPLSSYIHQSNNRPNHQARGPLPAPSSQVGPTRKISDLSESAVSEPTVEEPATPQGVENSGAKLQDKPSDLSGDGE